MECRIEFLQDRAGTEHHVKFLALAARKQFPVDPPLKGDRDPVRLGGGAIHRREDRLLLAHAFDHGVDVGFGDRGRGPIDREGIERFEGNLRQHLEYRGVAKFLARGHLERFDARIAGRPEAFLGHGLDEAFLHQIGDRFRMHLAAELLAHHGKGHLARPETLQARRARQILETLVDATGHEFPGDAHFEAALQAIARY